MIARDMNPEHRRRVNAHRDDALEHVASLDVIGGLELARDILQQLHDYHIDGGDIRSPQSVRAHVRQALAELDEVNL